MCSVERACLKMLRSQPSSHGEHVRQKRILLQPAAYDYTEWCSSAGARCGGAFLTTLLGRLVSSTSHIKMFWQDHEKFPEVWRGHAAHEPPLTSRVKCQRQHQQCEQCRRQTRCHLNLGTFGATLPLLPQQDEARGKCLSFIVFTFVLPYRI